MNISDLQQLAAAAGFTGSDIGVAAAIAMAESSGNPSAIGDAGNSLGLWQINLPAHPEDAGVNLFDPATNAAAAFSVWRQAGGSFQPWTTFRTGRYVAYLAAPAAPTIDATTGQVLPGQVLPQAGMLNFSVPPAPAASGSIWSALAIAAAVIFGLGLVLNET